MPKETVKIEVNLTVDIDLLAEQFAAMSDDGQARFLCLAAIKMGSGRWMQAHEIGRHLVNCECSNEFGREFIKDISEGMLRHG